jgi:hypothetical protein
VETSDWEGRGVVYGKPTPPRLLPPIVLVKDRCVGPREEVLNIPITCWCLWGQQAEVDV